MEKYSDERSREEAIGFSNWYRRKQYFLYPDEPMEKHYETYLNSKK